MNACDAADAADAESREVLELPKLAMRDDYLCNLTTT